MNRRKSLNIKRIARKRRASAKIYGKPEQPRLAVFRSARHIYAQLIDDDKNKTIVSASSLELKNVKKPKTEQASRVGELLAKKSLEAGVKKAVFDRRAYKFHGRVKAVAEGARKSGLKI